jgi:hypothetical protein
MRNAFLHAIGLIFAAAMATLGGFVKRHPEKMVRFFTFGAGTEIGFFVGFARVTGWLLFVMGIFGVILYLVLIPKDLMIPH